MKVVIVGGVAGGATAAARILAGHGFEAYHFAGSYRFCAAVKEDQALIDRAFPCGMDRV